MSEQDRITTWAERWRDGRTGFHMDTVHPGLVKWYDHWLPERQQPYTILVPLCGKSHDLKWLYNKGHSIVGVEAVESPVRHFFSEHQIPYTVTPLDSETAVTANMFQSSDGRLSIYCGDLFSLDTSLLCVCDAVWDRGSLVAVFHDDRHRYSELMCEVSRVSGGVRYLLETIEYDSSLFSGPPRHTPQDQVQRLLGGIGRVRLLETEHYSVQDGDPSTRMHQQLLRWNLPEITRNIYLISGDV